MLEFLRKHKMVVLGAMVLVFVGLVFIERNGGGGLVPGRGAVLATVGDTSYTDKDERLMGEAALQVAYSMRSIAPTVQLLMTGANAPTTNLMINRALIREEAKRLGVSAEKDTVDLYIQQMPEFQNDEGQFDVELYRKAIGMRQKGSQNREREDVLRSLIADSICFEQLQNIISRNLTANETFITAWSKSMLQSVSVRLAVFAKDAFMPKSTPGEAEIKAFWEKRKGNYNSDEERIITLYSFTPTKDKDFKAGDKKIPVGTMEVFDAVETFWVSLYKNSSKDLDQKLESMANNSKDILSFERKQFPLSSFSNAPKDLTVSLNPLSGPKQATLLKTAFAIHKAPSIESYNEHAQKNTLDQISGNEQISETCVRDDGSVSLIRIDAIKPVGPLSYEQAKELAKQDLIAEIADEAMTKAINNLSKTLSESKNLSADFEKLAQAAGATVKNYGPYDPQSAPEDFPEALNVYVAVKKINPGQITTPIISKDEAIIAELVRRTLEISPQMGATEMTLQENLAGQNAQDVISDWLQHSMKRYKVKVTPRVSANEQQEQQGQQ